ncbi:linear amide C-N hydrolase [Sediminitomix flava]|uniref:Penicillin amidase n=1 Tax=Sediminitomix flava TaxID=379075 RepID=A0A315Z5Y5_SEDFL|nr:linear amide C-N hydrolase [Sediminitomix flava]PWJ38556.1 penicillin amidase [Sediminitomix flava]
MCTRILYKTGREQFVTGRGMDWNDPNLVSNLWVFPKGLKRDGGTGENAITWTSKYGSVGVSFYDVANSDGINEKGFVVNALYLAEAEYGDVAERGKPTLSIGAWAQYFIDNYATVAEAVEDMQDDPFTVVAPLLPNGRPASVHLSISDPSGDSAIFEYVEGELTIHHSKDHLVMTNSPLYDDQLAIERYWKLIGGNRMLPGTINAADRFVRASYFLESSPKYEDTQMAISSVFSQMRSIGVPLGMADPDHPNISATLWRTIYDHENNIMYYESAQRPYIFWVDLSKVDLSEGADVMKLETATSEELAGDVSGMFSKSEPFSFLA